MSVPPVTVPGGSSYSDVVGDNIITADQTGGADLITITAANGADTIFGGGGDLIIDASANTLSVDVAPAFGGATTIQGGSGTLLVEPDDLGMEGYLTVHLADGAATINGSTAGTSIFAGTGDIQIIADHELSITGEDGAETVRWTPALGDVINVTTDSVTGVTTLIDTGTNISVSLFGGEIVVDATAAAGTVSDFANDLGTEVINLGAADVSVTAALGSDSINAGLGNVTVDASGNANPITVNGGGGSLEFSAGLGDATITGGTGSTIINGSVGTIVLNQHELTMVRAGDGTITVNSDGTLLSVMGEDGTSSTNWTVTAGDVVTITTDSGTHATTLYDNNTGAQTVLANGYATNYINGMLGGTVYDLPDHNVIDLMGGTVTVIASQGTDTITGGGMPGDVTVDATGNTNPVVVNATPMGALIFTAGDGLATVTGSSMGTTINGGNGDTTLTQHGATTIHAGNGTITVNSDGSPLTVFGADGISTNSWFFDSGDTVTIATNSVTHVTTVSDPNGSLSYTLPATVPPTVTIDPINGGATLNAGTAAMGLPLSGTTTGVEDGQTVTISVSNGIDPPLNYSPTVTGGVWSVTIPADVATGLLDGSHTITANVSNQANDPAVPATQTLMVDETAPMVAISSIAPVNAAAALSGFDITGTTDAEDGRVVTVSVWDGAAPGTIQVGSSFSAVAAGGAWSVHVPALFAAGLADGSYTVSADVSDQAGNAASQALLTLAVDETPPVVTIVNAGGLTNHPMQTVGGTASEIGGTVTVWDGLATVGSAIVGSDGHWTANITLTGEGLHSLTAQEADLAGNTGASSAVPYILDTIAPTVAIDGPGLPTNQPMQTVTGTASEIGGTVTLLDGSTILGTATVGLDGRWSTDVTLAGEGLHSLTAQETDAAGNTGISTPTLYTLDTIAPVVTITDLGGPTNSPLQPVSGMADLSVIGQTVSVWDGSSLLATTTVQPGGSWSIPVVLTGEQTHSLTASVTDLAGNTGTSAPVLYTLDMTPPTVTIASITPVNAAMAAAGFTISGTTNAEDGQMVRVQLLDDSSPPMGIPYTATVLNGAWSLTVPGSDHLADGSYTVTASVIDQAGNPSLPASQPFMVDETAPMVTMTAPGGLTNLPVQVLSGTADPTELGRTVTIWDGAVQVGTGTVQLGGFWTATATLTGDGAHNLTASVTDAAGNTGTSAPVLYTLDMTPPTVTIASIAPVNAAMAAAGFTISGTTNAENGQMVSVQLLDGSSAPVGIPYTATVLDGAWSLNVPGSDHLADGSYTVIANVTDRAGNLSLPTGQPFMVDETAPMVTIDGMGGLTNHASQMVSGTAEADGTVIVWDGLASVGSATADSEGNWSATVNLAGDGPHSLTASQADAAGNVGTSGSSVDYTLDATAPVVTIDSLGGPSNQMTRTVSGTATELGGTVTVWDGLASVGSATVGGDGIWSTTVQLTDEGPHPLTATETDTADNTGTSDPVLYTLDMTAPAVTILGTGGLTNHASQMVVGIAEAGGTVIVWDGASSVASATVADDGTWSATVNLGSDGPHSLTAKETDAAGNTGISGSSVDFTLDTAAPMVAITSLGRQTNQPMQTVTGTASEIGGTVTLLDGSTILGTATVGLDGRWSTDVTLAGEGLHSLTAQETDAAGNTGTSTPTLYTLDTIAPVVTITDLGGPTNSPLQPVSGMADLSVIGQTVSVWDGSSLLATTTVQLDGSWSIPVVLTGEETHSLTASVTDLAGNTGTSAPVLYTLDMTPPTVTIASIAPVNAAMAAAGFTISGTTNAENGQMVSVQLLDGSSAPVGLPYTAMVLDGAWSLTVPGSDHLADGGYTATASVSDQAGNPALPATQAFAVDETVPAVTIDDLGAPTNQPIQTVSGTATDLLGTVIVWDGATSVGSATVGLDGRWSTDVTLTGEGLHSLTAQETDAAGNTGSSAPVLYTLDTAAPAVTILGTGGLTNQANQMVSGTAEAGGTVIVWDGASSVASAIVAGDGTWSVGVNLGSDGAHSLTASETDTAGNTGSSLSTVDYTLDTVAPVVAITSLGRSTNQPTQTVSGTAEAGGTVLVWDGATALGTATAGLDGSWSTTVALAGDGSHSLTASETDGAGNTGTSNAVAYMLDTTPVASGDSDNPYAGAIGQRLADLLGSMGNLSYFGPNQPIPDASTGTPALLISSNDGTPVTVPGGVSVVRNQSAGVDLQGNGQADQVIVSSAGFTYHSNGGSGIVLADDAQAGGPAGSSNIVLARSGGGDFVISTGSGDDTVDAASGNVSVAAGGGHNMVWLGDGNALVTSSGADTVVSGSGAATVQATAGSQALVFGGGSTLSFIGGSGAATVVGGAGNTNLTAGSGDAVFWGSENGGNTMYAGTGAATLVGGGSGNVIHAAGSADLLIVAGTGNSTLVGGSATGNNFYWGSRGDDLISADQGNDTIIGGAGHDTVQAGGGNALIFGGVDGNTFVAGSGTANVVSGNGGANTFAFINGQAGGTEIIWGFRSGTDHLSLQGYGANELANATAGAQSYGAGTQIGLSDGTKIIFGDMATLSRTTLS